MAKKKSKFKLNKKQRALLRSIGIPCIAALVFLNIGIAGTRYFESRKQPVHLVWAADSSVQIPKDLKEFLQSQNDCRDYLGPNTRQGVSLWGVYQVSHDRFAKISYGCAFSLTNYILALKQEGQWRLVPPEEYFAEGALPLCTQLEKYKIDKTVESFCIDAAGNAKANEI